MTEAKQSYPPNKTALYHFVVLGSFQEGNEFRILQSDSLQKIADEFDELENVGDFLSALPVFGSKSAPKIWICIARFHEECSDTGEEILTGHINNDIAALIFANSYEEAKLQLKSHPAYQKDIRAQIADGNSDVEDVDVVEYVFGDFGGQLAQLCGDFMEVPVTYHQLIREHCGATTAS